ncbi:FtsX-like permease family protein [Ktedonospora formicarum]|uniref:ABC transporter permease n=1 Tax=Ktedonospora formicarum TaxID=2778364 RepID=A0A8J3I0J0_9CHLR|nr:ABC transporter permease [Ktedonospora formicarum]GHO47084.1 ABC transporter permease [Ktedonospora formicarum]
MNWRNLVTKNMLRNLRRYIGYMLAATIAVAIFAMFTNFVDNPAVRAAPITAAASQLLVAFRVLVALFAIFFVFYFHAALMRARNKEFGLLLTLGVTPHQIGRLIFYESLLIGLLALLVGIILGIVCAYFFQLAMLAILALPVTLPFAVPPTTFLTTGMFFGIVFFLEACWISSSVTRRTPRVLLLGARTQQAPPKASWWSVFAGLLCIGVAYDLALQFSSSITSTMFPIIGLTIAGTYLLFSQCSVMLLTRLRQPGIPGMRLLLLARLSHRMSDYARMLTVVTVLNAVVLIGMGTIFGGLQVFEMQAVHLLPFSIQLLSNTAHPTALASTQVQQEIERQHFSLQAVTNTSFITGTIAQGQHRVPVLVMDLSSFVRLQEVERQAHPDFVENQNNVQALTSDSQGYISTPDITYGFSLQRSQLVVGKETVSLQLEKSATRVINPWFGIADNDLTTNVLVVTDVRYAQLMDSTPLAQHWQVTSYVLPNWQQSAPLVQALRQQLPASQQTLLTDTVTNFNSGKQFLSVMLFAAFFISCLFFLAAGSAIYFKLFTQQEEDRRQFQALERIGFTRREAAHLLSSEFLLLFFLPIVLALVHSIVALLDLANLMTSMHSTDLFAQLGLSTIILQAFVPVSLLYLVSFMVYFWIARVGYLRRMQLAAA